MKVSRILLLGFDKKEVEIIPESLRKEAVVGNIAEFDSIEKLKGYDAALINEDESGAENLQKRRMEKQAVRRLLSQTSLQVALAHNPDDVVRHLAQWTKKPPSNEISQELREFVVQKERENNKALGKAKLQNDPFVYHVVREARKKFPTERFNKTTNESPHRRAVRYQ